MDPMILPISIMAVGQLATYLLGRWIERRKWLYIQNWKYRVYPVKPRPADSVHVVNPQQLERFMAKTKTAKEEGVFLVTSVTPEQVFASQEAADKRAAELAETHPGITFHVFESVDSVVSEEEKTEGEPKAAEA